MIEIRHYTTGMTSCNIHFGRITINGAGHSITLSQGKAALIDELQDDRHHLV